MYAIADRIAINAIKRVSKIYFAAVDHVVVLQYLTD